MQKSSSFKQDEFISVKKAKVHNLKNISIDIPRDQLVVITGPSGSGKSSLAFDTIYAEGQRRYVESLSTYARQFLEQNSKPEVESISGLSPTISIVQKTTSTNPRSTVGTVTEIYDYLRLLFSKVSVPYCWKCQKPIQSQSHQQISDHILSYPSQSKLAILAPVIQERKGEHQKEITKLRQLGFVRARINGEVVDLSEDVRIDKNKKNNIEVYVDRLIIKDDKTYLTARVSESVEMALRLGNGMLLLENLSDKTEKLFSEKFACTDCNINYPEPEPRLFSFNSPVGACPECDGLGVLFEEEEDEEDEEVYIYEEDCEVCQGTRLRKEALQFKIAKHNIFDVSDLPISESIAFFEKLKLTDRQLLITERLLKEIKDRLRFINQLGVGYLSLMRSSRTLSGGEAQRIRLATQIGSSLTGVTYVLDEPSIGLHPRDNDKLLSSLDELKERGNSVIVVEHDKDTIEKADWVIDMGPGAGKLGGEVSAEGPVDLIKKNKKSLTGLYLSGKKEILTPKTRRPWTKEHSLFIEGATRNNLKNINVRFPLGTLTCVTGISGSGKSTLVFDTLYPLLKEELYESDVGEIEVKSISGLDLIDKAIHINQKPIGRTPRSNPATYVGIWNLVRDLFASLPEAKVRGYKTGRFSFNVKGGRCENCEGAGLKKIEMHFLPNVYVKCESCQGARFNRDTLEIQYKGKSIADVLNMDFEEAYPFFQHIPILNAKLKTMNDVGLGYVHLGQNATTLSGGEAQRIKLGKELSKKSTGKTVYLLDEPTTGLHFDDIQKLIDILQALVSQGNTIIVIEHNLDIIKIADHIIDMGPDGGKAGGQITAEGSPEEVANIKTSPTARYIKEALSH